MAQSDQRSNTPNTSYSYQLQSVTQHLASLRILTNLFGIVYCQRTESPSTSEDLRTLLDCPTMQITIDSSSKSEHRKELFVEKYKAVHQFNDLELGSLIEVLHYHPNLRKILKTKAPSEPLTSSAERLREIEKTPKESRTHSRSCHPIKAF